MEDRDHKKRWVNPLVGIVAGLVVAGAWLMGNAGIRLTATEGAIVDNIGQPVKSAVVFAVRQVYEKQKSNLHGYSQYRCALVDSAVTDSSGTFSFPAHVVAKKQGWEFESDSVQFHVLASGYAPTSAGVFHGHGFEMTPGRQPLSSPSEARIALEVWDGPLVVTPSLTAALKECSFEEAELRPALAGFEYVFRHADLNMEEVHFRQWLNELGLIAVQTKFSNGKGPAFAEQLTNEQIRDLLIGDAVTARAQISLREGIVAGDLELVRNLLEDGIEPDIDDGYRRSRLWLALENGQYDVYRLLRKNGATWRAGELDDLLFLVTQKNDGQAARLLIAEGAKSDAPVGGERKFALIEAARRGYSDILKAMLAGGVDPDAGFDTSGETALQQAFRNNHFEAFLLLLEHGADPNVMNRNGHSLFMSAVPGRTEYATALLDHGVRTERHKTGGSLLTSAIRADNRRLAEAMLAAGFSPGLEEGTAPLAAAAMAGWHDMVKEMLHHPDALPGSDSWWQALWLASAGERETFDILLSAYSGSLSDPPDEYGCPVCRAATEGRSDTLDVLLARGAPIDGSARDGDTALMRAAMHAQEDIVKLLLKHGANVDHRNNAGATALAYASDGASREEEAWARKRAGGGVSVGRVESRAPVKSVIAPMGLEDRPSHIRLADEIEVTIASSAQRIGTVQQSQVEFRKSTKRGNLRVAQLLLEAGAKTGLADSDGTTPLTRAAAVGDQQMVDLLKQFGAKGDVKILPKKTTTPSSKKNSTTESGARQSVSKQLELTPETTPEEIAKALNMRVEDLPARYRRK